MVKPVLVNNLPLPELLVEMISNKSWKNPDKEIIGKLFPFLTDKYTVELCETIDDIKRESGSSSVVDFPAIKMREQHMHFYHEARGSRDDEAKQLPWEDVERSVTIAMPNFIGGEASISLDYRTDNNEPRVIAPKWNESEQCFEWVKIADSFKDFCMKIGIHNVD